MDLDIENDQPKDFWWQYMDEQSSHYESGGFHPVHIGDTFSKIPSTTRPRYKILAKLGLGGSATVWLGSDMHTQTRVALKLNAARSTGRGQEVAILKLLTSSDLQGVRSRYIIQPQDFFEVEGPNGTHEIIVTPVVLTWNELRLSGLPLPPAQRASREIAKGLEYIHSHDIVHGDLHTGNVGLRLEDFNSFSEARILEAVEDVKDQFCGPMVATDYRRDVSGLPKYIVSAERKVDWVMQLCDLSDLHIVIMDLGEAFFLPHAPEKAKMALFLVPPERLLDLGPLSKASDIWALGCTISEFVLGSPLFDRVWKRKVLLRRMVGTLGPFPESWSSALERAVPKLDMDQQDLSVIRDGKEENEFTIERVAVRWLRSVAEIPPSAEVIDDTYAFLALLKAMMRFEPGERMTIEQVVNHSWLREQP
ncbi:kinase-like protein [Sistotremastrum suecicum HHB10207 ss-3]|uniref:Kinase-like protein n=1 Tax=Sistotremastrum suecicum HHB10207 ss-3 TaxID=1314776 RepID=A0A166B750_9AGAM|nr:kinase-like protein [Sistotremastrum suecicum HHB10207 ss-3]